VTLEVLVIVKLVLDVDSHSMLCVSIGSTDIIKNVSFESWIKFDTPLQTERKSHLCVSSRVAGVALVGRN